MSCVIWNQNIKVKGHGQVMRLHIVRDDACVH